MNKSLLTTLLVANLMFSSACLAFGFLNTSNPIQDMPADPGWPHLVNEDNESLGLFGGLSSGYNRDGELERTILLVSSAGYVAPILNSGGIATATISYYQDKGCKGSEHLPAMVTASGYSPYRGTVFYALSSNDLLYIPKEAHSKRIKTRSQLVLDHGGLVKCIESIDEIASYEAVLNQFETTGISVDNNYRFVSVVVGGKSRAAGLAGTAFDVEASEGADNANKGGDIDKIQDECSPACLEHTLGNGMCDIECYVESCYFDKGDCDNLAPDVLQLMLSEICAPGCDVDDIGDGFCDKPCDTQTCQYDGGDCVQ